MGLVKELKAYCYSFRCAGNTAYHKQSALKDVPKHISICPDCNSALMWKVSNYRRGTEMKRKTPKNDEILYWKQGF